MPEEDKREAIRHTVECWLDMGDEEFSRHLAEMVYGQSTVGFTPPVARPTFRGRHVSSSSRLDGDRSSNGNRGFKLRDPKNPLAGTVVDDILPRVDDQHGGIRERERREEDSDKENTTISLDDDDILDQPDLPFKVQYP
ncbi:hypothetical protein MMC31_003755 [Peltigera leucophlebia]|nr:hypothetical protein [Peltigera leucophlebia]